jgi:septal ring factor EnvC (AmiA/AmiB activator)
VVRYYALAPTPNPVVQILTTQMQTQQAALASLQQSQQVVADQLKTINNYEQEIAALQTSLSAMQQAQTARDQDLADLKTQVQGLVKKTPKAQKRPEA